MKMVTVYSPGQECSLGGPQEGVLARIIAVEVRDYGVRYLCSWWAARVRYEQWVDGAEVEPADPSKPIRIGFAPGEKRGEA